MATKKQFMNVVENFKASIYEGDWTIGDLRDDYIYAPDGMEWKATQSDLLLLYLCRQKKGDISKSYDEAIEKMNLGLQIKEEE